MASTDTVKNILDVFIQNSFLSVILVAVVCIVFIILIVLLIIVIIALAEGREIQLGFIKVGQRQKKTNEAESNKADVSVSKEEIEKLRSELKSLEKLCSKKLDYIERLAVLPNFEIPPSGILRRISKNTDIIKDRVVLIRLDLEIPALEDTDIEMKHFKFFRAAETLKVLTLHAKKIIIAFSQGSVKIDIAKTGYNYHGNHVKEIISLLNDTECKYQCLNNIDEISDFIDSNNKIAFLPNLINIFPEENSFLNPISDTSKGIVNKLCKYVNMYILDDFRKNIYPLPLNTYITNKIPSFIGLGLERDIKNLEFLVKKCISFGREEKKRIAICGSLRPYDLHIIKSLLEYHLFDKVLLGPYPSIPFLMSQGVKVPNETREKLIGLCYEKALLFDEYVLKTICKDTYEMYKNNILLPDDFIDEKCESINIDELEHHGIFPGNDIFPGIGEKTIKKYQSECENASLVFHFGMLGSALKKYRWVTQEIIKSYKNILCFTAGDHISMLAQEIGFTNRDTHFITGAQTTAYFLSNKRLIGLSGFIEKQ